MGVWVYYRVWVRVMLDTPVGIPVSLPNCIYTHIFTLIQSAMVLLPDHMFDPRTERWGVGQLSAGIL